MREAIFFVAVIVVTVAAFYILRKILRDITRDLDKSSVNFSLEYKEVRVLLHILFDDLI